MKVVVSPELAEKLRKMATPLDLCDPEGNLVATIVPIAQDSDAGPYLEPQVSEAELDRREAANERHFTTSEVLAILASIP